MEHTSWSRLTLRSALSQYRITVVCAAVLLLLISFISTHSTDTVRWRDNIGSKQLKTLSEQRQHSLEPIQNSTLGFQKVLAISLPERTDHRDGLVLTAALSNFSIDFIDGVRGESIPVKALPPGPARVQDFPGALGAWRAHIDAISQVVSSGWGSALIFEDDLDWDIRLRSQLQDIALGATFVFSNLGNHIVTKVDDAEHSIPHDSPYGDNWDVMWLGHCGMELADDATVMVFENDVSVPQLKDIVSWNGEESKYLAKYPPHTRIVTEQKGGTCSLAYAVSQRGARRILYELGLRRLDGAFDLMLRDFCQGENDRSPHRCVSVLPQIFDHYRRAGPVNRDSDVGDGQSSETREKDLTFTIRWSARINAEKLLNDETDYIDQYPG